MTHFLVNRLAWIFENLFARRVSFLYLYQLCLSWRHYLSFPCWILMRICNSAICSCIFGSLPQRDSGPQCTAFRHVFLDHGIWTLEAWGPCIFAKMRTLEDTNDGLFCRSQSFFETEPILAYCRTLVVSGKRRQTKLRKFYLQS